VPPLVESFAPQVLVSQHGCDSHALDPLANLTLSVDGQRAAYLRVHELAHAHAGGRWLASGGGGYAVVEVVPRAWTHLLAIATGEPLAPVRRFRRPGAPTRRLAPAARRRSHGGRGGPGVRAVGARLR
jgi:acetoin utilization deacetylase AcuC-like enzyme